MPVRIGVIGCGAIAQRRHIPEILAEKNARLVSIVDPNVDRGLDAVDRFGPIAAQRSAEKIGVYDDYRLMLKRDDIDAVVVATPNVYHARQTIDALQAGKHVLVEKPMAGTLAEARAMIAAAKKAKKFLMVGQNQRLMPPHVAAKKILDSGKLGRVLTFRTSFQHAGPENWSLDGKQSWFFRKKEAVMGVCGDLGVHKADLIRYLLGEEIAEVTGFIATRDKTNPAGGPLGLDDNAYMTLKTKSGALGTMTISWTNYGHMEDNTTSIFCEKGVVLLGTDKEFGVIVNHVSGKVDKIKTGAVATNTKQTVSGIMQAFVASIVNKRPPIIDGLEGYKSLAVIIAAMESARKGKTMRVKG